jgi:hypothetical protein
MDVLQDFPLALSVLASAHRYPGSFRGKILPSTLKKQERDRYGLALGDRLGPDIMRVGRNGDGDGGDDDGG